MEIKLYETNWTKYQFYLVVVLIVSGTINSLCIELMNNTKSQGFFEVQLFYHPFLQADLMLMGKVLCLFVFKFTFMKLSEKQNGSELLNPLTRGTGKCEKLKLLQASLLDILSTAAMFVGLTMTNVSSFLILRGFTIVFSACLSKRKIERRQTISIAVIIIGFVLLGLADVSETTDDQSVIAYAFGNGGVTEIFFNGNFKSFVPRPSTVANNENTISFLLGDGIIILAQYVSAFQKVFEENLMRKVDVPPLLVAGWEGVFGFTILSFFVFTFGFLKGHYFDQDIPTEALVEIGNSKVLVFASFVLIISMTVLSFCGVSVTKEMSATTRVVLECADILTIWTCSLMFGWKSFHWLQVISMNY